MAASPPSTWSQFYFVLHQEAEKIRHLLRQFELCPRCGCDHQATHHPLCESALDDATVTAIINDLELRGQE